MEKWALIIGGSSGMGLATSQKLSKNGFNLIIIHRDRRSLMPVFNEHLDEMKKTGRKVISFNVDGTNKERINETLALITAQIPNLSFDLIMHALSRGNLKPFVSKEDQPTLTAQDIALTIDAMATNVLTWVQTLKDHFLLKSGSRLVTLTSAGSARYWKGYGAVAMAKSSLEILSKYLAVELASFGVRVNCINAGITDTPSLRFIPNYEELIEEASNRNPLGRMTLPEDIANAIYLLTLPESNWINGNVMFVDGGEHLMG